MTTICATSYLVFTPASVVVESHVLGVGVLNLQDHQLKSNILNSSGVLPGRPLHALIADMPSTDCKGVSMDSEVNVGTRGK